MLKLQSFGHLMWRIDSLKKTLMLGKIEGKRRRLWQRMRWLASNTDSKDVNLSKLWDTVKDRGAWRAAGHGVSKYHTQLSNWTTVKSLFRFSISSWFSLGRWYVSRNLFISSMLTNLLVHSGHLTILCISVVSTVESPLYISNFIHLSHLFFSWWA